MRGLSVSLRHGIVGAVVVGWGLLVAQPVLAQRSVVADLSGDTDEAIAVSLLLRSMLREGPRPAVPRDEVLRALERVPSAKRFGMQVDPTGAAALLKDLGADRLVSGELLRDDVYLNLTLRAYDRAGTLISATSVRTSRGEVASVALEGAKRIAGPAGLEANGRPAASLGELRPFVRAVELMGQGNNKGAAEALSVANPSVAARVSACKEIADVLWRDTTLPPDTRMVAAMAAGEAKEASKLGEGAGQTVETRAQSVRAAIAMGDLARAEKDLARMKGESSPTLSLARAELLYKKGKVSEAEKELKPLLDKSPPDSAALSFVASLPPKALSASTESNAVTAAQRVSKTLPGVASAIGMRATRGGSKSPDAIGLVSVDDMAPTELSEVDALLEGGNGSGSVGPMEKNPSFGAAAGGVPGLPGVAGAPGGVPNLANLAKMVGGGAGKSLLAGVQQRQKEAKVVELGGQKGGGAHVVAEGAAAGTAVAPTGSAAAAANTRAAAVRSAEETTPQVAELAKKLVPLLDAFPPLAARPTGTVTIYQMKGGGSPFWSMYTVNQTPLRFGLSVALSSTPYDLGVVAKTSVVDELTHDGFAKLATRDGLSSDFILLYKATSEETDAHVYLALYDVAESQLLEYDDKIPGEATGLVRLNLALLPIGVAAAAVFLGFVFLTVVRVGEVRVDIKRDPGSEDEALVVVINKKPKAPPIEDIHAFHKKVHEGGPKRGRMRQSLVPPKVLFPRVPVGSWYVHLYGTQIKGGEIRELPAGITQKINVKRGETVALKMDIDPNAGEFKIRVTDGDGIAGALIYVDGNKAGVVVTDAQGGALLHIPLGAHVVTVEVGDLVMTREVTSAGGKVQVLNFDLPTERRLVSMADGIAVLDDDHSLQQKAAQAAMAQAAADKAAARAAGGVSAAHEEPEDDGISLPEGFHISIPDPNGAQTTPSPMSPMQLGQQGTLAAGSAPRRAPAPVAARAEAPVTKNAARGLSRYQRIAELGRGAMGVVFQGRDLVLERDVAIKIISDEVRQNQQALDMFFQEAKAMASLNHPNLVTVFDQGSDGDETFLVMELVEGQTLEHVLEARGTLPLDEALGIVEQLSAGLAYAHGRRILHRDIKPANIFLSHDGVVKIGDFGLARAVRQARLTQTKVCGTPLYMSPEQIRGAGVDFRSDLYSVGCTLFELVTGRPPFVTGEVMYHHMYTAPPAPSEVNASIPKEIDQLVLACLEKEMDKRISTADALRATIRPLRDRFTKVA